MITQRDDEASIDELTRALGLLVRRMRASAPSEQYGLSWTQKSVMARLEGEGPATTAELARAEGVKPQSMATALSTLEDTGMIERKPDRTDGRQVKIRLTAKGASMRKTSRDARQEWLSSAIAKLSKKERATLFEAGEIMKRLAEL